MKVKAAFILFLYSMTTTTWALNCLDCMQTFPFDSTPILDIDGCYFNSARQYISCSQFLQIDYQKETATLVLKPNPDDVLDLSNVPQVMTNKTMIWLDKIQFEQTFQINCFHVNACTADTIKRTYANKRAFEYSELWAKLVTGLYDSLNVAAGANLNCADNQDKQVACPNGVCQLVTNDFISFSRSCIRQGQGSMKNGYGIVLESKTVSENDIQSSMTYTCNKPMCNSLNMAKEIQKLFDIRGVLFHNPTTTTTTTTTTTKTTTTTTVKRSSGNALQSMISIHFALILFLINIHID